MVDNYWEKIVFNVHQKRMFSSLVLTGVSVLDLISGLVLKAYVINFGCACVT